jgi:hypothetical protein
MPRDLLPRDSKERRRDREPPPQRERDSENKSLSLVFFVPRGNGLASAR